MNVPRAEPVGSACRRCGSQVAAALLSCPACGALVHADALGQLARTARQAAEASDPAAELTAWRKALVLLPPQSKQHETIAVRVKALETQLPASTGAPSAFGSTRVPAAGPGSPDSSAASGQARSGWAKGAAGASAAALLFWKFKFILAFVATKAKLLILGLTKASTFFSMLLSLGVYWTQWGWKFALGLIVSMYVHEMGHVAALLRYGIKASSPLFVPGLGAFVRLRQNIADPRQDARVGLAGPLWGLAAVLAVYAVYWGTGWASWAAIAKVGAWINLFNLLPVWQFDGGRAFNAMSRPHRWLAVGVIALTWVVTHEGLLVLLLVLAIVRAVGAGPKGKADHVAFLLYIGLVAVLSRLCLIHVPVGAAA